MFKMKELKEFRIAFVGLKEGRHDFEYQIDTKFFDAFQYDEFFETDLKVKLAFVKKPTMLELDFSVRGTVNVPCDQTGEPFDLGVQGDLSLLVKFGENEYEDTEEILYISHAAYEINVAQYVYEMVVLSVPIKRIHPQVLDGTSTSDALQRLETFKLKKNTKEIKNTVDPRWGKLQELLIDKKQHNGTSKKKDI